jgi:hypothetical protein
VIAKGGSVCIGANALRAETSTERILSGIRLCAFASRGPRFACAHRYDPGLPAPHGLEHSLAFIVSAATSIPTSGAAPGAAAKRVTGR